MSARHGTSERAGLTVSVGQARWSVCASPWLMVLSLFACHRRGTLYRFSPDTKEWKERGRGDAKLLKHKLTGKVRFVMREEKTLKLRVNHFVAVDVKPNAGSDRSWTWA